MHETKAVLVICLALGVAAGPATSHTGGQKSKGGNTAANAAPAASGAAYGAASAAAPGVPAAASNGAGGKVDINSASIADIAKALGVSESLAKKIAAKRPYKKLEDLIAFNFVSQTDFQTKEVKKKLEVRAPKNDK